MMLYLGRKSISFSEGKKEDKREEALQRTRIPSYTTP
jgi:hypothetical protein